MLASDVYRRIKHAVGGDLPSEVSFQDIANEAGVFMTGMRGWHYLTGETAPALIVTGQDYIDLPSDFVSLEDIRSIGDWYNRIIISTGVEMNEAAIYGSNPYHYVGVVTYRTVDVEATATTPADKRGAVPIIRISPVPTSSIEDALQVVYQRGWMRLTDDNQAVTIPSYMEGLYLEICGEYARGVQDTESASVGQRLAGSFNGALYHSAKQTDANMSPGFGTLKNGIGARGNRNFYDQDLFSEVNFL
jgi:hypothetical protein